MNTAEIPKGPRGASLQRTARPSTINPINPVLRWCQLFFSFLKNGFSRKAHIVPDETEADIPTDPTEIKNYLRAEKERIEAINALLTSKDYTAALSTLMSDTNKDLHYFNRIKGEAQGEQHMKAFSRKHGKLRDFDERPPSIEHCDMCIWNGDDESGNSLRCQNTCLYNPGDKLGVERPKSLNYCAYHVKYCANTDRHLIPKKIRTANNLALCNECFVLRNSHPPEVLDAIPGTVTKL